MVEQNMLCKYQRKSRYDMKYFYATKPKHLFKIMTVTQSGITLRFQQPCSKIHNHGIREIPGMAQSKNRNEQSFKIGVKLKTTAIIKKYLNKQFKFNLNNTLEEESISRR